MLDKEKILKVLNLCYRFIGFRLRTEEEIEDYLLKKREKYHLLDNDIFNIIQTLKEENLINDKDFVDCFVRSRISRKQKSTWVLKKELIRHGVNKDLVEDFFSENPLNEIVLADKALGNKWERWRGLIKVERFKKAASFLVRRGFSFDVIKKTIAKYEEKS